MSVQKIDVRYMMNKNLYKDKQETGETNRSFGEAADEVLTSTQILFRDPTCKQEFAKGWRTLVKQQRELGEKFKPVYRLVACQTIIKSMYNEDSPIGEKTRDRLKYRAPTSKDANILFASDFKRPSIRQTLKNWKTIVDNFSFLTDHIADQAHNRLAAAGQFRKSKNPLNIT